MKKNMSDITKQVKNFGLIKNVYNNILSEAIVSKNNSKRKLFKEYVNKVKDNEILKNQFLVFTNIENKVEGDISKVTQFIKENIELFSKYTKKEILEANKTLIDNILFEKEVSHNNTKLYENISFLIFTPKTPETIDSIVEATDFLVKYVINNKKEIVNEAIELPTSMLSNIMVDKFNEKYSSLDESDKKILRVLIESDDDQKKEIYISTIKECVSLINEKLNTDDLEMKGKLLMVKERLLNIEPELNEDFEDNIGKLIDLKSNLNNN